MKLSPTRQHQYGQIAIASQGCRPGNNKQYSRMFRGPLSGRGRSSKRRAGGAHPQSLSTPHLFVLAEDAHLAQLSTGCQPTRTSRLLGDSTAWTRVAPSARLSRLKFESPWWELGEFVGQGGILSPQIVAPVTLPSHRVLGNSFVESCRDQVLRASPATCGRPGKSVKASKLGFRSPARTVALCPSCCCCARFRALQKSLIVPMNP